MHPTQTRSVAPRTPQARRLRALPPVLPHQRAPERAGLPRPFLWRTRTYVMFILGHGLAGLLGASAAGQALTPRPGASPLATVLLAVVLLTLLGGALWFGFWRPLRRLTRLVRYGQPALARIVSVRPTPHLTLTTLAAILPRLLLGRAMRWGWPRDARVDVVLREPGLDPRLVTLNVDLRGRSPWLEVGRTVTALVNPRDPAEVALEPNVDVWFQTYEPGS